MIYFDNAATTWPKPESVYKTMDRFARKSGANPGRSGHMMAVNAGRIIFETRSLLAHLFNIADPMRVVFTLNATDAINLALKGLLKPGDHVVMSQAEHNSVVRPLNKLAASGVKYSILPLDQNGRLLIEYLDGSIRPDTKLVILAHASNVLGTLQPIEQVGNYCRDKKLLFMVDAAQTAGILPIDTCKSCIDLLAFPGHKSLLGPQGTGGLYIREDIVLDTMREGGTGSISENPFQPEALPDRYESGTPNSVGIAGVGAGVKYIMEKGIDNLWEHEKELTGRFLKGLGAIPKVIVYGRSDLLERAPVVSINIGNINSAEVSTILDSVYGIATRSGLHCSPLIHKHMGTIEQGTVRFSFGCFNTADEIDAALNALEDITREL